MANGALTPGDAFIYMKVGVHAKESLADILIRKRKEIADAGVAFWGYGGNTCHPLKAVQPFVKEVTKQGLTVRLLMEEINSHHFADQVRAEKYSVDGVTWKDVPTGIDVLGSRYALVLENLDDIDLAVDLANTRVGVGRFLGSPGSNYVRGRVDKACLRYAPDGIEHDDSNAIPLKLEARLAEPYAVLLKND